MAITYIVYETTGSTADFAFSFPYISTSHVKVLVDGTDLSTDDYTVVESPSTKITCSPAIASGKFVKVYRETPGRAAGAEDLLVDFQDGSVLSEADLDAVCQQLLYLSQEAEENATSSLSIDYDDNYTAGERRIKELSGTVSGDRDAATKEYVDGKTLYAGATSLPQMWAKVGSDFTGTTGDCTVTLTDPAPSGDNDNLYVVAFNGDTQTPTTDFAISGSIFTLKMGAVTLDAADKVTIINFGVARQYIKQPITGDAVGDVSLTVKEITDQTADLQQWQDTSGASLAKVAVDGDATFVDINATGNADVDGNLNVDGSLTVDTTSTLTGDSTVGGTLGVTGATTLSDTLGVTGATTLSGGASVTGDLNLLTGALQYAGEDVMSIRQIVTAVAGSNRDDTDSTWTVSDLKCSVTPKTATSKFLLLANLDTYCYDTTDPGTDVNRVLGVQTKFVANTTASAGAEQTDGSDIGNAISQRVDRVYLDTESSIVEYQQQVHIQLYEPGSADAFTVDVVHIRESTHVDLARIRVATSTFYIIEIG